MPTFTDQDLEKIAELSKLAITEDEKKVLKSKLEEILAYFELLKEVDVGGMKPCSHVIAGSPLRLREDTVQSSLSREEFLALVPDKVSGMVKVPTILNKEEM